MSKYMNTNLRRWDELVPIHENSAFYDVQGFKNGKTSLFPIEMSELRGLTDKSLLHLQCHFGMDTLSLARLGANVTGVDFSEVAIASARALSDEIGQEASFLVSNVYDLPSVLKGPESFDIVFTSYGVLCWLPNLVHWGQVINHFLKPGGTFYIVEFHPFAGIFYDENDATELTIHYPYFHSANPVKSAAIGSYADRSAVLSTNTTYEWSHSLSDIINALISADLKIEFVHEFPYSVYSALPLMRKCPDGFWRLKDKKDSVPFMFSIKATK